MQAKRFMLMVAALFLLVSLASCKIKPENQSTDNADINPPLEAEITEVKMTVPKVIALNDLTERVQIVNSLLHQKGIAANINIDVLTGNQISVGNSDILLVSADDYRKLAASGELADLTDKLNTYIKLKEINSPMEWRSARVDGAIFGIPLTQNYSETECAHHSGMYIRTDILNELGLPVPETVEDLVAASLAAKDAKLDYRIAYEYTTPPYALHRTYKEWPFYVDTESMLLYDDQGSVAAYPGSDAYYNDALTLSSMNEKGILRVFQSADEQYSALTRRWDILATFCPAPPPSETIPYTVLQFEPQRENFNFNYAYANLLVISRYCTDPDRALDVLECIYTDREVNDAFVYGKRDKDYSLDEKGRINILTSSVFYQGFQQRFLARENAKSTPRPAFYSVSEGSLIDTFPARLFVPSAIDDRTRLLQNEAYKGKDGILALRIALSDPAAIDATIERLDRDGLAKYIEECQAEYKAFLE